MFVRQLIGREAGTIIDLPFVAAQSSLAMGTCQSVTDDEIAEAGLAGEAEPFSHPRPDQMPPGYLAVPSLGGGFDVVDAGGVTINDGILPNLPAARSFAYALIASQSTGLASEQTEDMPRLSVDDLDRMTRPELENIAAACGIPVAKAMTKGDIIAALTRSMAL